MNKPPEFQMPNMDMSSTTMELSDAATISVAEMIDRIAMHQSDPKVMLMVCLRIMNAVGAKAAASLEVYHNQVTPDGYEAGLTVYNYLRSIIDMGIAKRDKGTMQ